MPELPEVESVARQLRRAVLGRRVTRVLIHRADVITPYAGCSIKPRDLLKGLTLTDCLRHGKQLALIAGSKAGPTSTHRVLLVHLGMSGRLWHHRSHLPVNTSDVSNRLPGNPLAHVHVQWRLDDRSTLSFADPRRFGGLWTYPSLDVLRTERWSRLGADAIEIEAKALQRQLARTGRAIKAALLDQNLIAGLGNIYVDEALFAARIHPQTRACDLAIHPRRVSRLATCIRDVLARASDAGGSTLTEYGFSNLSGQTGRYQHAHAVYGRAGQSCRNCSMSLVGIRLAGRATVYCPRCQRLITT